jgi:hypothetical protein
LDAVAYAFLLGMYLGDGSIARHPRAYKLRVVQDARYPNSIEEIRRAMATGGMRFGRRSSYEFQT